MKPTFKVTADSADITSIVAKNFHSLEILDARGLESDTLTLTITDPLNKIAWPQRDVVLSVSIGYVGKPLVFKGQFVADEVEHQGPPDIFVIRARAAEMMP